MSWQRPFNRHSQHLEHGIANKLERDENDEGFQGEVKGFHSGSPASRKAARTVVLMQVSECQLGSMTE